MGQRHAGGTVVRTAAALKAGDVEKAKKIVQPVMESRDAASLIEKIKVRAIEYIAKFALFNAAMILSYGILISVFSLAALGFDKMLFAIEPGDDKEDFGVFVRIIKAAYAPIFCAEE